MDESYIVEESVDGGGLLGVIIDDSYIMDESVDGGGLLGVIMDDSYIIDESVDGGGLLGVIIDDSYIIDESEGVVLERGTRVLTGMTIELSLITFRGSSSSTIAATWEDLALPCRARGLSGSLVSRAANSRARLAIAATSR